jgi:ribosomal protein S9
MSARYYEAVGRRKTSSARVRVYPGTGNIVVNDKPAEQYFGRGTDILILTRPLRVTDSSNSYNISVQGCLGRRARYHRALPGRSVSSMRTYAAC